VLCSAVALCGAWENALNKLLLIDRPSLTTGMVLAQPDPDRIEAAQLIAWLLKDLGWVLVVPFISLPAAAFAILSSTYILYHSFRTDRSSTSVLLVAELLWLLGNSAWMLSEMLWDLTPDDLPWSFAPVIQGSNKALYDKGVLFTLALFRLGLFVILVAFVVLCIRQCYLSDAHQRSCYVFGLVSEKTYSRSFVALWIAKDMFWVLEDYRMALAMGVLALCVVFDSARRFRAKDPPDTHSAYLMVVEMLWILGNIIWMSEFIPLKMIHPVLRMVSVGLFVFGLFMVKRITVTRKEGLQKMRVLLSDPSSSTCCDKH